MMRRGGAHATPWHELRVPQGRTTRQNCRRNETEHTRPVALPGGIPFTLLPCVCPPFKGLIPLAGRKG